MTAEYKKRAKRGWNSDKDASNREERRRDVVEITEQLEETSRVSAKPVTKKKNDHKDITRLLSRIRWIYKLCKGDIEYFNKHMKGNEWIRDYYQSYYQEYRRGIPQIIELSKRDDLPNKIMRQIKEVMVLFRIETNTKQK